MTDEMVNLEMRILILEKVLDVIVEDMRISEDSIKLIQTRCAEDIIKKYPSMKLKFEAEA